MTCVASVATAREQEPASLSREAWIWKTVLRLRKLKPSSTTQKASVEQRLEGHNPGPYISYEIEDEGLIPLENQEWVYIVAHSTHESDRIGDISLGIDSKGSLFMNSAHVCGLVSFSSKSPKVPRTGMEFFKRFTATQAKRELPWKLMQVPKPPPLSKEIQALLHEKNYEGVLEQMPTVIEIWQKEQSAVSPFVTAGARIDRELVGPVRLMVELPPKFTRYFGRVYRIDTQGKGKLTDQDLGKVASLSELSYLDMGKTPIIGTGLRHLVTLKKLNSLSLTDTRLTKEAYMSIGQLTNLGWLWIDRTPINDSMLPLLYTLPNLKQLSAVGTDISMKGAKEFRKRRPTAKIFIFAHDHPMYGKANALHSVPKRPPKRPSREVNLGEDK